MIELITSIVLGISTASAVILYCYAASRGREITETFRREFLKDATTLMESGEMPEWSERRLLTIAKGLFSRRRLYQQTRIAMMLNRGVTPTLEDMRAARKSEDEIPAHLRHVWERTVANGLLATAGAEPVLGAIFFSQLLAFSKAHESKDGQSPQATVDMGGIDTAMYASR